MYTRSFIRSSLAVLALTASVSTGQAQQWNIDAEAGRIRSALDPNAPQSQTLALGLRYDDALTGFRLSGGVPTNAAEPLWGAIGGARRVAARKSSLIFGVDVAGNALVLHDREVRTREVPGGGIFNPGRTETLPSRSGAAFAAQALPIIGFETARLQAHARAGVSQSRSRFGDRDLERTVRMADAQLTFAPSNALLLMPAVRHYRADEGNYTYAGVSALAGNNLVNGWATVGQWLSSENASTPWAAGATLRFHERAAVNASVRHDAVDPLYLAPAQTAWNVGVSILLAGKRPSAAPVPARYEGGRATIRVRASSATSLSIAGDFNAWKPAPMQRAGKEWTYTTALKPGVYNYAFVDESGEWFVPEKHPGRKDDGMGGHVAVLVVEP